MLLPIHALIACLLALCARADVCANATKAVCGAGSSGPFCEQACAWNVTSSACVSVDNYPAPSNGSIVALTGVSSPLAAATWVTVTFYGDSITWLGLYEAVLSQAFASGPGTENVSVRVINQGCDGCTASDLVVGYSPWGHLNPWLPQTNITFAQTLEQDGADIIGVQIGINDVLQQGPSCGARCSNVTTFVSILRDELLGPAIATGARVYLASVSTIGERLNGSNQYDGNLTNFAAAAAALARELDIPFIDLRDVDEAYETENNCMDLDSGILTYDGIHPSARGAANLANQHASGILQVLEKYPVPPHPAPPGYKFGGRVFLTSNAYSTNFGGIAGADATCTKEAGVPAKALLVDEAGCAGGNPCRRATLTPFKGDGQVNWVLCPRCMYFDVTNTTLLGMTDDTSLFAFPFFRNSMGCINQASGMQVDWTTVVNGTCNSWSAGAVSEVGAVQDTAASATPAPVRSAASVHGERRMQSYLNLQSIGWSCGMDNGFLYGGAENWPCDSNKIVCVTSGM